MLAVNRVNRAREGEPDRVLPVRHAPLIVEALLDPEGAGAIDDYGDFGWQRRAKRVQRAQRV